jgi:hypothetical protein
MRMAATICAGISKNMPGLSFAAAISSGNYWPNGKRAPVGANIPDLTKFGGRV